MSSQIIPLKARADSQGPSRITATDTMRLSCNAGDTQLGAGFCRDLQQALCKDVGHRSGRDLFRSEMIGRRMRWTFRAKRACVVITDAEPDRLAPLTPPAPMGLRGVWVVAARCCADSARC